MNPTSFLIVFLATFAGATGLYVGVKYGMNASDEYAQRLSVNSTEYLLFREKALAAGKDPTKIKANATRSQKPSSYDDRFAASSVSAFIRADSDAPLADVNTVSPLIQPRQSMENLLTRKVEDKVGRMLTEEERKLLAKLIAEEEERANDEVALIEPETEQKELEEEHTVRSEEEINMLELLRNIDDEEYVYTVSDEIRRQLATEEMSDEKRETLESVLPQESAEPVRAVDVRLKYDTDACVVPRNSNSWIGVMFRNDSTAIRGTSLNALDELVVLRERCEGTLTIEDYKGALGETDIGLRASRRDEVRYYLLQRRVPKESIEISTL